MFKSLACALATPLGEHLPPYHASLCLQQPAPSLAPSSAGGGGGGDRVKTQISSRPRGPLHRGRREDTFIKPESGAHPGQPAEEMRGQSATSPSCVARRTQPHGGLGALKSSGHRAPAGPPGTRTGPQRAVQRRPGRRAPRCEPEGRGIPLSTRARHSR